jgi:hypothetical protein
MEMGEDSWEHHVTPLLMNCGQAEDNNVGGVHEEYLPHTEEVSAVSLTTRDAEYMRMAVPFLIYTNLSD